VICMARAGYVMKFRRRREGKTDYRKRLALVKSGKPILTVRRTNTQIIAHIRGIKEAILDIGRHAATKGARVFAVLKGAVDAGLEIPHSDDRIPDESRIRGEHISEHVVEMFKKVKENIDKMSSESGSVQKKMKSGKKK